MNANDINLIHQMIRSGRQDAIQDLLPEYHLARSKELIKQMGTKWCCHPDNQVKRLDIPLPILNEPRGSKILKGKK